MRHALQPCQRSEIEEDTEEEEEEEEEVKKKRNGYRFYVPAYMCISITGLLGSRGVTRCNRVICVLPPCAALTLRIA
jgi:hypothetical protein